MPGKIKAAFDDRLCMLPLSSLLPLRRLHDDIRKTVKYRRIARSIEEIGVIEPIVVCPSPSEPGRYPPLDGQVRRAILLEQGETETRCLVARDDESFTYNKRINGIATIQEHFMIVRALERGVSEEKLARALNVDLKHLRRRKVLLDGICP